MEKEKPIYCLWSGGWDSTFRILQLVILEKKEVQPIYVYDKRRKSKNYELHAIRRVLMALLAQFRESYSLVKPVKIISKSALRNYSEYTGYFKRFDEEYKLGVQYLWFARLCRQYGFKEMEVCFIRHSGDTTPAFNLLLESQKEGVGHECRVVDHPGHTSLELFRSFRFPTIHLTKVEMVEMARTHGFHSLLQLSWYCFSPLPNGEPCGECHPCKIAGRTKHIYSHGEGTHKPGSTLHHWIKFHMFRNRFWKP
jgi:hypothetical protein